jgi:hypothetical protein
VIGEEIGQRGRGNRDGMIRDKEVGRGERDMILVRRRNCTMPELIPCRRVRRGRIG